MDKIKFNNTPKINSKASSSLILNKMPGCLLNSKLNTNLRTVVWTGRMVLLIAQACLKSFQVKRHLPFNNLVVPMNTNITKFYNSMLTSADNSSSKILWTKISNCNNIKKIWTTHFNKEVDNHVTIATSRTHKIKCKSSNRGWRKRVAYKTWTQASIVILTSKISNSTISIIIVLLSSMK